jgi:hypothetical protein
VSQVFADLVFNRIEDGEETRHLPLQGPELLILYDAKFGAAANDLRQWKVSRGLKTEIKEISSVGKKVKKVKREIRRRLRNPMSRLRYVLLLGDVDSIDSEKRRLYRTDYFYSTLLDRRADRDFPFPIVAVGRISVTSYDEASDVVSKIINYEKQFQNNPDPRSICLVSEFADRLRGGDGKEDFGTLNAMEDIRKRLGGLGHAVERIYTKEPGAVTLLFCDDTEIDEVTAGQITDNISQASGLIRKAFDQGRSIIAQRGQGYAEGWQITRVGTLFDKDSVPNGSETSLPSVVLSITCDTGDFHYGQGDCFAEHLLKVKFGGAVSVIAATFESNVWNNNRLMKGLFDALRPDPLPTPTSLQAPIVRLGDVLIDAKAYVYARQRQERYHADWTEAFEIYHIIGDPTLEVWRQVP